MSVIRVLSAAAVRQGLASLGESFGAETGAEVNLTFTTGPNIRDLLEAEADVADLVIAPDGLIDALAAKGRVLGPGRAALGGVEAGVAIRTGAKIPDISTGDAVRQALLAAEVVVFNKASSGDFIAEMIAGLGVADEIADRIKRFDDGAEAMKFLGETEARGALGFGQSTGLKIHEPLGVTVIGPLPTDIGKVTTYVAAPAREASDPEAVGALIAYLTNEAGREQFRQTGVM